MPGFKTFNHTDKPMWVTIYTLGGVFKEDWGNVDPGTAREWRSGHYAGGSYYKVRAEWDSKFDTNTTKCVDSGAGLRQLVLLGGDSGVYWSDPVVRVENQSGRKVWVTIYLGGEKVDWGSVDNGVSCDWAAGGPYSTVSSLTLLAEWEDPSLTPVSRDAQETPPNSPQKHSVQCTRDFGEGGNGVCISKLAVIGGEVVWVDVSK